MNSDYLSVASHDAFRYHGLGKSAAEAFWFLHKHGPMTEEELSARTGRSPRTIHRVLEMMSRMVDTSTGELIQMVEFDGHRWHGNNVDLDLVAMIVGTAGIGKRQKAQHKLEREWRRQILAAVKKNQQHGPTTGQEADRNAQTM